MPTVNLHPRISFRMKMPRFLALAGLLLVLTVSLIRAVAAEEAQDKVPCDPPKAIHTPDPVPPESWVGRAPKNAEIRLEVTVDKKGKVHDPVVIKSGGHDADKSAIEAVRNWRFIPAKCGQNAIETKTNVVLRISLR